jgi:DNA polymerase-3 subunit epsilon
MREMHGALLDAKILAEVYLAMTGGQVSLSLDAEAGGSASEADTSLAQLDRSGLELVVLTASDAERDAHAAMLAHLHRLGGTPPLWEGLDAAGADNPAKSQ